MSDSTTPNLGLTLPEVDKEDLVTDWGTKLNTDFTTIDTAIQYLKTKSNYVNVKDYGAVGDGTTDDTAAFSAAIATGKSVFVPGTTTYYKLSTTPTISTPNQRIFGEGNLSKIVQTGTNANSSVFLVTSTNGVVIEDLYLVPCSTVNSQSYGYGVFIQNSSKCVIRNCLFTGYKTGAAAIYISDYCTISGCTARNSIWAPPDYSTTGTAFSIIYGGNYNTISDNICISGATGIGILSEPGAGTTYGNTIARNRCVNMGLYAIVVYTDLDAGAPAIAHTVISDNNIDGVTGNCDHPTDHYVYGTGIYVQGCEYTSLTGNVIYNVCQNTVLDQLAPAGIGCTNCTNVNIVGNTIRKVGGTFNGITVRDPNTSGPTTGFANIVGNHIFDVTNGIQAEERGRVNIASNVIDTCVYRGIFIQNTSSKPFIDIQGNLIRNVQTGISIAYVAGLKVSKNHIEKWGTGGNYSISIDHATDLLLQDNYCLNPNSGAYGINIASTVTSGFATGNYVTGTVDGFILNGTLQVVNNHITGNSTNYDGTYATSVVKDTELAFVAGVTSALQTQLNAKAPTASPTFTGTITTALTASRALATDGSSALAVSATTATELGYVSGVTSAIQTQINAKAPTASPTFTGTVTTPVTASRALVTDAGSALAASATTATELGYVSGVTSAIQTQLGTKIDTAGTGLSKTGTTLNLSVPVSIANGGTNSTTALNSNRNIVSSGGALVESAAITASRALVSDTNGLPTHSTVTTTELGYVSGVTSALQTQINTKAPSASPTFTGTVTTAVTASRALVTDAGSALAASATTATELGYVSGVTSAIQTQMNAKAADAAVVHNTGVETVAGAKTFTATPVVSIGTADDTAYSVKRITAQQGTAANWYVYTTTTITTAKKIWEINQYCECVWVTGTDGTNIFGEMVMCAYATAPKVVSNTTLETGAPAARTYSVSAGDLRVAMASGTYRTCAYGLSVRGR